jgi:hypothetical protein
MQFRASGLMVTESYQKPKTPQIKFAGFYMLFCHPMFAKGSSLKIL